MVLCKSAKEAEQVKKWRDATSATYAQTLCIFNVKPEEHNAEVLVLGQKGPVPKACKLEQLADDGDQAPKQTQLPSGMKDDAPVAPSAPKPAANHAFRITVAKEWADVDLAARAAEKPDSISALTLPENAAKLVIRTKGAMDYDTESTCVITVRAADAATILASILPTAGVLQRPKEHGASAVDKEN